MRKEAADKPSTMVYFQRSEPGQKALATRSPGEYALTAAGAVAGGLGGYYLARLIHKKPTLKQKVLYAAAGGALGAYVPNYIIDNTRSDVKGIVSMRDQMRLNAGRERLSPRVKEEMAKREKIEAEYNRIKEKERPAEELASGYLDFKTHIDQFYDNTLGEKGRTAATVALPPIAGWYAGRVADYASLQARKGLYAVRHEGFGRGTAAKLSNIYGRLTKRPYSRVYIPRKPTVAAPVRNNFFRNTGAVGGAVLGWMANAAHNNANTVRPSILDTAIKY